MTREDYDKKLETIANAQNLEDLSELKASLQTDLTLVKNQIGKAKSEFVQGKRSEDDWFHKAQSFKRTTAFLYQRLMAKEGEINRKAKIDNQSRFERKFVDAAREYLPQDQFDEIFKLANR